MLSRFSVAITYPLLLLSLVVGIAFLFGGLGVTGTERVSRDLLDRVLDQATERVRLAVRSNLSKPRLLSRLNGELMEIGSINLDDLRGEVPSLWTELMGYPSISAILVSNADTDTVWVERRADGTKIAAIFDASSDSGRCYEWLLDDAGRITGDPIGSYPYDPQERPWHKTAMNSPGGAGWTPLYAWASSGDDPNPIGSGYATLVTAKDGSRIGVTDVGFTVDAISSYLSTITVSENGRLFVMNAEGYLVAGDSTDVPCSLDGNLVRAEHSSCVMVSHAADVLNDPSLTTIDDAGFTHSIFTEHDGTSYLVDATSLGVEWGPNWRIVTVIPEGDLLSGVHQVQSRLIYWGVAVLVVAGLAGLLLSRTIVRPIIGLRKTATQIAAGDLNVRFSGSGGREYLELAEGLDSMCRGLKERLELRSSLEVAMDVQQHMLPSDVPVNPSLDIAAFSTYCDETGGDYYDFPEVANVEQVEDGSVLIAIGDVTGHGIAAALIMASARAALRTRLRQGGTLGEVLGDVNDVLVADTPDGKFMTFMSILVSADGSSFRWAGAGHDPPLLFNSNTRNFSEPNGGHIPLGIMCDQVFDEYESLLGPPGSILLTGTDGIWETANPEKELYGKDRLRSVIMSHADESAQMIGDAIIKDLNLFRCSDRPLDDVTMVVVKRA
ncbi:MAG: SpoIIE family protein phosphatase [Phycisphaerales bacterium]|nr:SpoIIE family protein phosphatase [Phycisphaerales bacterium]